MIFFVSLTSRLSRAPSLAAYHSPGPKQVDRIVVSAALQKSSALLLPSQLSKTAGDGSFLAAQLFLPASHTLLCLALLSSAVPALLLLLLLPPQLSFKLSLFFFLLFLTHPSQRLDQRPITRPSRSPRRLSRAAASCPYVSAIAESQFSPCHISGDGPTFVRFPSASLLISLRYPSLPDLHGQASFDSLDR